MKPKAVLPIVLSALFCANGFGQSENPSEAEQLRKELAAIKQQQKDMQDAFEKRIKALEDKLAAQSKVPPPGTKNAPVYSSLGPIQFSGVAQGRFDTDSNGNDTFFMRRLELKFNGKVSPQAEWTVMVDPAKALKLNQTKASGNVTNASVDQTSNILQDAYLTYHFTPTLWADLGRKKIPFSYEGLQSAAGLDIIERALFISQGKWGDARDIGLQLNGKWNDLIATAAVLNGDGEASDTNSAFKDANAQKSVAGRLVYAPSAVSGLSIGASGISGQAPDNTKHERYGAEAQFKRNGLTVRAEYAMGLQSNARGYGWYGHIGYAFTKSLEGVLRYDEFNLTRATPTSREADYLAGINYFVGPNTKLQLNYVHKRFFNGSPVNNQLLANFQVSW